jgi:phosphoglycolate phosphatase-like HAD superfamily hydrolase
MNARFDKKHLIAIDSDGCVFDGMSIKHREAFIPAAIEVFALRDHAELYREIAEDVNLFSDLRGINRFESLFSCLALTRALAESPPDLPDLAPLGEFVRTAPSLSNTTLAAQLRRSPARILAKALAWSEQTNRLVADLAPRIPVFSGVAAALQSASQQANLMVCSAAARASLEHEWSAAKLEPLATFIAGQEFGPKAEQIRQAARTSGIAPDRILLLGDAIGDLDAACTVGVRFFPILPGAEESSWLKFHQEILPAFVSGTYSVEAEAGQVRAFRAVLGPPRYAGTLAVLAPRLGKVSANLASSGAPSPD